MANNSDSCYEIEELLYLKTSPFFIHFSLPFFIRSSQLPNIECDSEPEKVSSSDNVQNVTAEETSTKSVLDESNIEEGPTRTVSFFLTSKTKYSRT